MVSNCIAIHQICVCLSPMWTIYPMVRWFVQSSPHTLHHFYCQPMHLLRSFVVIPKSNCFHFELLFRAVAFLLSLSLSFSRWQASSTCFYLVPYISSSDNSLYIWFKNSNKNNMGKYMQMSAWNIRYNKNCTIISFLFLLWSYSLITNPLCTQLDQMQSLKSKWEFQSNKMLLFCETILREKKRNIEKDSLFGSQNPSNSFLDYFVINSLKSVLYLSNMWFNIWIYQDMAF